MFGGLFVIILIIITGVIFGVFKKVPNQDKTEGTIISVEKHRSSKDKPIYSAKISYTVQYKEYIVEPDYRSNTFKVGNRFTVYYNWENPEESFVKPPKLIYFVMALFIGVGIFQIVESLNLLI